MQEGPAMAEAESSSTSAKPLIESDRVEGTTVYGAGGERIGTIKRLMIEKISGRVAYAVVEFGFWEIGEDDHTIPWSKLEYDTSLGGLPDGYHRNRAAAGAGLHAGRGARLVGSRAGGAAARFLSDPTLLASHLIATGARLLGQTKAVSSSSRASHCAKNRSWTRRSNGGG